MLKRIFFAFLCLTVAFSGFFTQNSFVKKAEAAVLLQDDFSGTTINTALWDETDAGGAGGTAGNVQQNDQLSLVGSGTTWGINMLQSKNTFSRSADVLKVSMDMTVANCSGTAQASTVALVYGGPTPTSPSIFAYYSAGRIQLKSFVNGAQIASTDWVCTNNIPFNMRLELPQDGGAQLYINDVLEGTLTASTLTNAKFSLQGYGTTTAFVDNIEISQGAEEATAPDAPAGLSASAGDTEVDLTWTAPSSNGSAITDYIVEYKLSSEPTTWTAFSDGTSTSTSATVTGLTNDSAYDFRVSAVNAIGISDPSDIDSATPTADSGGGEEETALLEDLVSHWKLDETSGTRADAQGSNNLTSSGTAASVAGKIGNAFAPTGIAAGGTLSIADNASLSMGNHDFTLSAWANFDTSTNSRGIAIKWGTGSNEYGLYSNGGKFRFIVNGSGGYSYAESPTTLSNGTWYFLVGWYDSNANTVNLKINNGTTISVPFTGGTVSDGTNPFTIGSFNGGNYVDGSIDSVSVWKRTLTEQEMTALYNSGTGMDYPFDAEIEDVTEPDAPTNLIATAGDSAVGLTWSVPAYNGGASITDYIVEYKLSSEPTAWTTFDDGVSTSLSTTVTGLTNDSAYDFRVSAVNAVGTSAASEVDSATPSEAEGSFEGDPVLEDDFAGTAIDTDIWEEVDAAGAGGSTGNVQQNGTLSLAGNTSWGANMLRTIDTFDRTSGDLVAQGTFTLSNCATGNTVAIVYGGPTTTGSDSYFGYYHDGAAKIAGFGGASGNLTTDFTCTNNVPFTMALLVKQSGGAELYVNGILEGSIADGAFTNLKFSLQGFTATPGIVDDFSILALGAPSAPQNVSATPGNGQVGLTWDASEPNGSAITDYRIDYKAASESSWTTFSDGTSTNTSTTVTGLTNGLNYSFRIFAISANGQSGASSTANATPVSGTPAAPQALSVAITGYTAIGEVLHGTYTYADPNGNAEAGSAYRWLRSATEGGTYEPIAGATSTTYTPLEADNGYYLKFEVTPITSVSPTTGTPTLSDAFGPITQASFLNTIISTGQSLAIGRVGSPALSTTQPYNNVMLSGAGSGPTNETGGGGRGLGTSLIPLVEVGQESIGSSMANGITHLTGDDNYQIGVINNANGGTAYSGLKKGSSRYTLGMGQLDNISAAAETAGKQVRVIGVTNIHGETDNMNGVTYAQYKDYLEEWQSDYQTDVFAKTGQTGVLPMFTDQMSTCTSPYSNGKTTCHIAQAQLDASEENPGKIILVGPKYFFNYIDQHHLTNSSYRWLGEYYAKVMYKVLIEGETWRPLSPDSATISGSEIFVNFHVPAGQLQFDTTMEPLKTNYGFEYYDSASSASITNVEIIDTDTVKITLSNTPTGSDQRIRYAYTGVTGVNGGEAAAPRGNLRDTDPAPSQYGNTLYNWAVHFDEPLAVAPSGGEDEYNLTYSAGAHGSVTGSLSQTVPADGSGTTVTAVPDEGYMFMGWSDGSAVNPRTDVDVNDNVNAIAQFAIITGPDNDPNFLSDLGYQYLFRADYNNSNTDSVNSVAPTGTTAGYADLADGYAASFTNAAGSSLSYNVGSTIYDDLYDEDGFTLLARYRLDSMAATGATYAGSVAGVFDHTTNNRSWLLVNHKTNNATQLATSAEGSSVNFQNVQASASDHLGEWATVVISYDGAGHVRAYQSSANSVSTQNLNLFNPADSVPLVVGRFLNDSMTGLIDYVQILDKGMTSEDIGAYFDQEAETPPAEPGNLVTLTNQTFVNSEGLALHYDVYYMDNASGPVALISDSWTSNRSSYTAYAKYMAENHGFIGLALDTRGKNGSQGLQDALGYECRDVYELIEYIKNQYSDHYDDEAGASIFGFSGAGGRALMCSGRYPDYFSSVYATGSVASMTGWYLANVATSATDRSQMRERTGNSINPGVAKYYPTGGETAAGATENQEAYTARSADEISAYNTLSDVYITYQTGDPRVPQTLSLGYISKWNDADKAPGPELVNFACSGSTHAICDLSGGYDWMNSHQGSLAIPDAGNFKIGGWVETKKFRVEFLDDVGYVGDVDYDVADGEFEFAIDALSYTGPTEVLVKDAATDLVLYDGDTVIGEIVDGDVVNDNEAYNITYSGGDLRIVVPNLNENTIRGLAPADSEAPVISDMSVSETDTTATITWITNELSSSKVEVGLLDHLVMSPETDTAPRVTSHSVTVTDLVPCTMYSLRAYSTDADGNTSDGFNASINTTGCAGDSNIVESATQGVTSAVGGTVNLPGVSANGSIDVPAGATGSDAVYQIKLLNQGDALNEIDSPSGVVVAGDYVYDLKAFTQAGTPITSFNEPITVTLSYSDNDVSGIDESSLVIYHYSGGTWAALADCVVDTTANTVTCTTTGFSVFGIFGTSTSSSSSSSSGSMTRNRVGTNILAPDGTIYTLTADGYRRPYTSAGAFLTYGFNSFANAVTARSGDMKLPVGSFIPPRDGSIVCSDRGTDAGTCYLITNGMKAGFTSEAVFKALGFSFSYALYGDVSFMSSATNISSSQQAHKAGVLVNNNGTLQIVGNSDITGIPSMAVLESWGYNPANAVPANSYDKSLTQSRVLTNRSAGVLNF